VFIRGVCRGKIDDVLTLNGCTSLKKVDKASAGPPLTISAEELGSEERTAVICDFLAKDGQTQLAVVEVGDEVVVRGLCKGSEGLPSLDSCNLVKE
jgi:hypothetical protein